MARAPGYIALPTKKLYTWSEGWRPSSMREKTAFWYIKPPDIREWWHTERVAGAQRGPPSTVHTYQSSDSYVTFRTKGAIYALSDTTEEDFIQLLVEAETITSPKLLSAALQHALVLLDRLQEDG